ncbi:MAG: hypothetical protein IJW67_10040, partial [Blautia sp.]|nr:hypothetical protein [Blautia sp.]
EPAPEQKEVTAEQGSQEATEKTEPRVRYVSPTHETDHRETADKKERKSVLGRLNEKKEQVKAQPKKSGPNRAQEASI